MSYNNFMKCIEISSENIINNLNEAKKLQPNKKVMAVVKTNAYGHGVFEVCSCLINAGVNIFCVADVFEGIFLRKLFPNISILVLYGIYDQDITLFKQYNLELTVSNLIDWNKHKEYIFENNLKIHLKYDSGMNRVGFKKISTLMDIKEQIQKHSFKLVGLYTHIAQYEVSYDTSKLEVEKFKEIVNLFKDIKINYIHYQNSASIQMFKTNFDNAIRIGNFLYGYYDFDKDYAKNHLEKYGIYENLNIRPILRLKTNVKNIKHVKKGEYIGYGSTTAKNDMDICFVDFGKLDGIIKVVNHKISLNSTTRFPITPPAMNHMFIKLNPNDKIGDSIYLYEDLNYEANELNCRPIDFIAYLDSNIKRQIVKSFK